MLALLGGLKPVVRQPSRGRKDRFLVPANDIRARSGARWIIGDTPALDHDDCSVRAVRYLIVEQFVSNPITHGIRPSETVSSSFPVVISGDPHSSRGPLL